MALGKAYENASNIPPLLLLSSPASITTMSLEIPNILDAMSIVLSNYEYSLDVNVYLRN
jgi:hypothetical protein